MLEFELFTIFGAHLYRGSPTQNRMVHVRNLGGDSNSYTFLAAISTYITVSIVSILSTAVANTTTMCSNI